MDFNTSRRLFESLRSAGLLDYWTRFLIPFGTFELENVVKLSS